jgi:hypothetical protein
MQSVIEFLAFMMFCSSALSLIVWIGFAIIRKDVPIAVTVWLFVSAIFFLIFYGLTTLHANPEISYLPAYLGPGNYTVALIEIKGGEIIEFLPSNVKFEI